MSPLRFLVQISLDRIKEKRYYCYYYSFNFTDCDEDCGNWTDVEIVNSNSACKMKKNRTCTNNLLGGKRIEEKFVDVPCPTTTSKLIH